MSIRSLSSVFLLSICTFSLTVDVRADEESTSLTFVKGMGISEAIGNSIIGVTQLQVLPDVICALGNAEAKRLVQTELKAAIARHQAQWDHDAAAAWRKSLSEDEMRSLLSLRQQSPYFSKFRAASEAVGQAVMPSILEFHKNVIFEAMDAVRIRTLSVRLESPTESCKD